MMQIENYLFFGGNGEEALNFYQQALGGKTTMLARYAESPMDNGELPADWKNKVMHATFEADGARFMVSDTPPGQPAPSYGGFSMSVYTDDKAKAERIFKALAAGGKVTMPFEPPFWGGTFGMLTDKFGVPWMVSCDK